MITMLQSIDREDLETLWKLVKAKHENTRPDDDYERVLWGDLKVMFEPDIKSEVWRSLQGYKVTVWKLFDNCRVDFVRNIVHALGGKPKRKGKQSPKDIVFLKVEDSPIGNESKYISNSESVNDNQEPSPPLPKLLGARPKPLIKCDKKQTLPKPSAPEIKSKKNTKLTTKEFLLTLMQEVKGLKEHIKPSSESSTFVSQTGSSMSCKDKMKTKFGPVNTVGLKTTSLRNVTIILNVLFARALTI
ncbi:hypothetical protein Tco_0673545 [Tanacetum coccineum]